MSSHIMGFNFSFPGGRLGQDTTSVVVANNTARTIDTTVPTGKRWMLLGIKFTNPDNVSRDCSLRIYKQAAKTNLMYELGIYGTVTAGAARVWPNTQTGLHFSQFWFPVILDAGNTIQLQLAAGGTSAGGTDTDGLDIEYLEVQV